LTFQYVLSALANNFQYILSREDYPTVYQLASALIKELAEQRQHYQLYAKGLLLSLTIELYRIEEIRVGAETKEENNKKQISEKEQLPENPLTIAPALDFIEENYAQRFSVDQLADLCHWSPTHFRRVFHSIMGTSPLDYINNIRIQKSCALLHNTDASILDISEMVGFHSISSYNRCFTKILHKSPRDYRRQVQQGDKHPKNPSILEYAGWMSPE